MNVALYVMYLIIIGFMIFSIWRIFKYYKISKTLLRNKKEINTEEDILNSNEYKQNSRRCARSIAFCLILLVLAYIVLTVISFTK